MPRSMRFCTSCASCGVESLRRRWSRQGVRPLSAGLGKRAVDLSNSGGPSVLCADRASQEGLSSERCPSMRRPEPAAAGRSVGGQIHRFLAMPARTACARLRGGDGPRRSGLRPSADDPRCALHGRCRSGDRQARELAARPPPLMHSMMGTLPDKADCSPHGARGGADVQRRRGDGGGRRAPRALSRATEAPAMVFCPRLFFAIAGAFEPEKYLFSNNIRELARVLAFLQLLLDM